MSETRLSPQCGSCGFVGRLTWARADFDAVGLARCPQCGHEQPMRDCLPKSEARVLTGSPQMTMRDRCAAVLSQAVTAEELAAFVVSEIGRAADERLEASLPLCLYFETKKDRAEFIAAVREAKPGMVAKTWPAP